MNRIKAFLIIGSVLLLTFSSNLINVDASAKSDLPKDGVLNIVLYEETALNKDSVQIQKTTGFSAESKLVEKDGILKGDILINEGKEEQVYSIQSTNSFKKTRGLFILG